MSYEYPEQKELDKIRYWDTRDPRGMVEYLEEIWWTPEWGFRIKRGRNFFNWVMRINLSTGGWSGNEDIITALRENFFWILYWRVHRTGGHYTFEVPIKKWNEPRRTITPSSM